jgi:hypothetical protein
MSNAFVNQQVCCRRCRFRFTVQALPSQDWLVEAQCPSCDGWACFTDADTPERSRPDPKRKDREAAAQRLGEQLRRPIDEHRAHPAVAWFDRVGNGLFEDDYTEHCWPIPWWVYRFTRRGEAAYVWQEEASWFVRDWHPLRGHREPPAAVDVFSFEDALGRLVR